MWRFWCCWILAVPLASAQTIKFATVAPEGSTWMNVMQDLAKEADALSQGRVRFKFYPGARKGDEQTIINKMKMGAGVDAAGFAGLGLGEIAPEVRVLDLPFVLKTDAEVDQIYEKMFDRFAGLFEAKGYVLLGFSEIGFVYFFSRRTLRTLEDYRASRCWLWSGDPVAEALLKRAGIAPVPLSLAEVLTSLQTGVIDTFYSPPLGAVAMQWHSKIKCFHELPMTHSTGGMVMTKQAFHTLSPGDQEILRKVSRKHLRQLVELTRKENERAIQALKGAGIQFVPKPDAATLQEFERISSETREALVGKVYSRELLDEVLKTVQDFRAGAAK
jgi:TRAP-type C4-dicarboxylate transport system substrate-binding protein